MRPSDDADDADEELLDEHPAQLPPPPPEQVVHAAAVQRAASSDSSSEAQLLHPSTEEAAAPRPQWGVELDGDEMLPLDDSEPARHAAAEEVGWRVCLHDRNAEFTVCGRVTTRRNLLRVVLSPAGVALLMVLAMTLWLLGGSGDDSSDAEPQEDTDMFVVIG
jgi:hypothetical protein